VKDVTGADHPVRHSCSLNQVFETLHVDARSRVRQAGGRGSQEPGGGPGQSTSRLTTSLTRRTISLSVNLLFDALCSFSLSQFEGDLSYVTKCKKCKTRSERPSKFLELELTMTVSRVAIRFKTRPKLDKRSS